MTPGPQCSGKCYAMLETAGSGSSYIHPDCPKHGTPSPAERLLKAAELLEGRASEATEGPWTVGSALDMLSPPRTWHLEGVERWRGVTNNVQFGEDEATARYIATVHPGIAKALALWLLGEAHTTQRGEGRGFGGTDLHLAHPHALALADLLLAGEQ